MRRLLMIASKQSGSPALAAEPPAAPAPAVTITLGNREGHVTPSRRGFTHTGGGNIDVAQPAPDTVAITMTGVAVAGPHPCKDSTASQQFELIQAFEIGFEKAEIKKAKLTVEGRVIGLLRSHSKGCGSAEEGPALATVIGAGTTEAVSLSLPS